jgi:ABC-2 type transport system ATP-binding protein
VNTAGPHTSRPPVAIPSSPGAAPAIAVSGLVKSYPDRRSVFSRRRGDSGPRPAVLRGVSLEVGAGEIVALTGPNGAGKTTLLEILSAVLLPSEGTVEVCGWDIVRHPARARDLVSYAASSGQTFYPRLTGLQNIEFFATLNGMPPGVMRRRIPEVLQLVGLGDAAGRWVQSYSDGMKQRLSLARALLKDSPVLLLDEPTRGLDPAMQESTRRLLRQRVEERPGMTVLLVTHNQAEADAVADRVAVLRDGVIAQIRTPSDRSRDDAGTGRPADARTRSGEEAPA